VRTKIYRSPPMATSPISVRNPPIPPIRPILSSHDFQRETFFPYQPDRASGRFTGGKYQGRPRGLR
jgi:hypothetical protein